MAFVAQSVVVALGRGTFTPTQTHTSSRRPNLRSCPRSTRVTATLGEKFGHLRNADIPSVADTLAKFADTFARPIPIVYRSVVNELLTTSHLSIVTAMWQYDVLFAYGFESVFTTFLSFYPNDTERESLRTSIATSLGFDPAKLAADAETVSKWIETITTYDGFVAKLEAASSDDIVASALRAPKKASSYEYFYSRCYGLGVISLMQAVGDEVNSGTAEKWAKLIGLQESKLTSETGVYASAMERLKQAEQIFAEAAAREAKKTADRLAKRAEAAAKKLEEIEKGEVDTNTEGEEITAASPSASTTTTTTTAVSSNDEKSS